MFGPQKGPFFRQNHQNPELPSGWDPQNREFWVCYLKTWDPVHKIRQIPEISKILGESLHLRNCAFFVFLGAF
jgi:hypothetical protein